MPVLLVAALVVVPIVELYVLLQVGQVLGIVPTLVLLVVMSLLGAYLLRREGARTWSALRSALAAGRLPAREVADGGLVVLGGALLLTPGFATDAFGLLCVLPPTRAVLRRLLTRTVARRLSTGGLLGAVAAEGLREPRSRPASRRRVVDGEVVKGARGRRAGRGRARRRRAGRAADLIRPRRAPDLRRRRAASPEGGGPSSPAEACG